MKMGEMISRIVLRGSNVVSHQWPAIEIHNIAKSDDARIAQYWLCEMELGWEILDKAKNPSIRYQIRRLKWV